MSRLNGDKARFQRRRKATLQRRARSRAVRAALTRGGASNTQSSESPTAVAAGDRAPIAEREEPGTPAG